MLVAALVMVCAMTFLAFAVIDWSYASDIDHRVNTLFAPFRAPWLVQLFAQVTSLGTIVSMSTIVIIVSGLLWSAGRLQVLIPLWVSFVGAEATTWSIKYGIDRVRPDFITGITEANPSFPSGHATASTVVLGFIAFIIARDLKSRSQRVETAYWAAVAIATICLSRMFLSLHYLSDVLAGWLVGSLWLLIGVAITQWQINRAQPSAKLSSGVRRAS
uniref:undecaprenyl-diphosphate phosphatase n=1 Tax=Pseudomonas graminis TaxID=158627 RepID=A0A7C2BFY4_9PSED